MLPGNLSYTQLMHQCHDDDHDVPAVISHMTIDPGVFRLHK